METDELVPISALQHYAFCPRQCGLIHLERAWAENRLTVEGDILHERVKEGETTAREALRTFRSLPLVSHRLGLVGLADVVEIRAAPGGGECAYPVEYKRGRPKAHDADRVQLCAQALCIEEMLGLAVPEGALFYGEPRRRETVRFDAALRATTEVIAADVAAMMRDAVLPPPRRGPHCRACSLEEICRPQLSGRKSAARFMERARCEA
jgi:CRISPR-associated exonuclease Cas4